MQAAVRAPVRAEPHKTLLQAVQTGWHQQDRMAAAPVQQLSCAVR